jgi:hypothetical protein
VLLQVRGGADNAYGGKTWALLFADGAAAAQLTVAAGTLAGAALPPSNATHPFGLASASAFMRPAVPPNGFTIAMPGLLQALAMQFAQVSLEASPAAATAAATTAPLPARATALEVR